jgi:hypothetical protein
MEDTRPTLKFEDLRLSAPLLGALVDAGYDHPTPIQSQAVVPAYAYLSSIERLIGTRIARCGEGAGGMERPGEAPLSPRRARSFRSGGRRSRALP